MASIVAGAIVIGEFSPELSGNAGVFDEDGVLAVGVGMGDGVRRDVFGDPVRVACTSVEGGGQRGGVTEVADWAWEAVLEETGWVDGAGGLGSESCVGGQRDGS